MQLTQGVRRSSLLFGNRPATVFADRVTSWRTLAERVALLAGGLVALGFNPGDRIAILSTNSDRYVEAFFAIAWAGCISVPINTRWTQIEIEDAINDSECSALFVGSSFADYASTYMARGLIVVGMEDSVGTATFDSLIKTAPPVQDRCSSRNDLACIFYTGGTTGRSKGVMLSHTNLLTNFLIMQAAAPFEPNCMFLHAPPMFHLADAHHLLGLSLLGATHVILPGFEPVAAIEAIKRYQVNALVLVPTMIGMLCERLQENGGDMSSVKRLTYGASPISSALLERAIVAFPNAMFCQSYGQTEVSPCATLLDHADHLAGKLRSAGRPLPTTDLRIVDEDLNDVAVNGVGQVIIRGPCVMQGYWNQSELTAETIVGGWLKTGDAGYLDEEGYLFLVDRVKDMIISGGENIYSLEVENALLRHRDVLQCAVIGVPDDRWGERVHAFVHMRAGHETTEADLLLHCEPLIANFKRPKSIDILEEGLPVSGVGKIMKTELRKRYWRDQGRQIA